MSLNIANKNIKPESKTNKKMIKIGQIAKTNGLKGICAADFYIAQAGDLDKYDNFYDASGKIFNFSIYSKTHNNKTDLANQQYRFLIKIADIDDIEQASKLVGKAIYVDLNELENNIADAKLQGNNAQDADLIGQEKKEEEFYIGELIGLQIIASIDPLYDKNNSTIDSSLTGLNKKNNPVVNSSSGNINTNGIAISSPSFTSSADITNTDNNTTPNKMAEMMLGQISAVHDFGAGPLLEINPLPAYQKYFGPMRMFEFNEENFPHVDLTNKKIYFKMPEFN